MANQLAVNDHNYSVDVDDDTPLLWVIRDIVGLTGTKFGCGAAQCGACTVHIDGVAHRSCVTPVSAVGDGKVTTIEHLASTPLGQALQKAWLDEEVVQCGYCQSGQLMQAAALLTVQPAPSDADIDQAMSGNICRCGTYGRIRTAINVASRARAGGA
ncbi:(2Fe-2S)-binding protein [Novosphingobium sp. G106]|uniref:(2Fe-2S)-binding protein n=1 Tax=Novosphingobium sp. G106 TaxID=2849500 RepID=UPI001C2D776F|nr:(2Fe-2S)-binding protein [Novosphingobium sp. G106]MBV1688364.1 (2Fe-2S)-binding protein [Novosphingobium sp. G106]